MEKISTQAGKDRRFLIGSIFALIILIGLGWSIWSDESHPSVGQNTRPIAAQTSSSSPPTVSDYSQPDPTQTGSSQNTISEEERDRRFALIESQVAHHWSWNSDLSTGQNLNNDRDFNKFEFLQTCDWLNHSKAGETELARRSALGAGYTAANFEIYLKGCGDDRLQYLSALKALHPGYEAQLKSESQVPVSK